MISNKPSNPDRNLIQVHLGSHLIERKPQIKILGVIFQENASANLTITKLISQINSTTHILRRVTKRHIGLKEHEIKKAYDALIISRVLYSIPYLNITKTQLNSIKTALRKTERLALGVPNYTPLHLLEATGLTNTLEELVEIHKLSQCQRLTTSSQGRKILESIHYDTSHLPPIPRSNPPWNIVPRVAFDPIPKHMNPENHTNRRNHRSKKLKQQIKQLTEDGYILYYTDAHHDPQTDKARTAVHCPQLQLSQTRDYTQVPSATTAETQAIAEAFQHASTKAPLNYKLFAIVTDSQQAIRNLQNQTAHIYSINLIKDSVHSRLEASFRVIWAPGHGTIAGNVEANTLSRVNSTPGPAISWPIQYSPKMQRQIHHRNRTELLHQLRVNRQTLPTPLRSLSREDTTTIRRAQTHTLPSPHFNHYFQQQAGLPVCPHCGGFPNNEHVYWSCPETAPSPPDLPFPPPSSWNEWLTPPPDLQDNYHQALLQHIKKTRELLNLTD